MTLWQLDDADGAREHTSKADEMYSKRTEHGAWALAVHDEAHQLPLAIGMTLA